MRILGIETSCDETAAAIVAVTRGRFAVKSNIVSSQIKIHRPYGGVVPEIAARNHIKNIIPVIERALNDARVTPKQIDRIAVTAGPGLITSLLVGAHTAKTLAYLWRKPISAVNHLKAHLYAAWLMDKPVTFPALGLIVSGGHTELILMRNPISLKKIGQTIDDAAGEAFDKVAQILSLSYPGGPIISKLAEKGDPAAFAFPRPMLKSGDFNFSFAGLKTAVLYTVAKNREPRTKNQRFKVQGSKFKADIAASFQQAVVDVLVSKTIAAARKHKVKTVILSGGVAANNHLRKTFDQKLKNLNPKLDFLVPPKNFCTDNAAMIAAAGYFTPPSPWQKIDVDPNWEIK